MLAAALVGRGGVRRGERYGIMSGLHGRGCELRSSRGGGARQERAARGHPSATKELMTMARVLVIDDDPDIREIIGLVLEAEGLEVLVARDGVEALEMLMREPLVDLAIVDLMMPRMSGAELVKCI